MACGAAPWAITHAEKKRLNGLDMQAVFVDTRHKLACVPINISKYAKSKQPEIRRAQPRAPRAD